VQAGSNPLRAYESRSGERLLLSVPYQPQWREALLSAAVTASDGGSASDSVVPVE